MADNYVHPGKTLDYTNAGTEEIKSGDFVVMSKLVGVAKVNIAPGKVGAVAVEGVYSLKKKDGDALSLGDAVYWVAADKVITKTATGNTAAGKAAADSPATSGRIDVKLNA